MTSFLDLSFISRLNTDVSEYRVVSSRMWFTFTFNKIQCKKRVFLKCLTKNCIIPWSVCLALPPCITLPAACGSVCGSHAKGVCRGALRNTRWPPSASRRLTGNGESLASTNRRLSAKWKTWSGWDAWRMAFPSRWSTGPRGGQASVPVGVGGLPAILNNVKSVNRNSVRENVVWK